MLTRFEWIKRINTVEREHAAARFATDFLLAALQRDPNRLEAGIRFRDIRECAERLEGTYLIRLFAEFETSLRSFWRTVRRKRPPARTRDLVESIGAMRSIPDDRMQDIHRVREDRNVLVHERKSADFELTPISQVKSHLCFFLSFLPDEW